MKKFVNTDYNQYICNMREDIMNRKIGPRDLMIGDYFMLKSLDGKGTEVIQINGITKRKFGYVAKNGQERYVRFCENRLIPIEYSDVMWKYFETTDFEVHGWKGDFKRMKKELSHRMADIKTLHELQHIINLKDPKAWVIFNEHGFGY